MGRPFGGNATKMLSYSRSAVPSELGWLPARQALSLGSMATVNIVNIRAKMGGLTLDSPGADT
jgi:hypothetical protein